MRHWARVASVIEKRFPAKKSALRVLLSCSLSLQCRGSCCWWSFLPPCQLVKILVNCLRLQFHQLSRFDEDANAIGSQSAQVSVIGGDVGGECNPCLSPPTTTTPLLHRPHHLKIDSLRLILSGLPIASLKAILSRGGVVPAPAYYGFPR